MQLTKQQRLEAYKWVRENIGFTNPYICNCLYDYVIWKLGGLNFNKFLKIIDKVFPEFWKHKPDMIPDDAPWWPRTDRKSRIELLDHIIKEMENDNN